jgi:CRP-like cAMP-binding protein
MISIELLRRYPFFAELDLKQLGILARDAKEIIIEAGELIFDEGEDLTHFYFVLEGKVNIYKKAPRTNLSGNGHKRASLDGSYPAMEDVTVCSIGPGELFGWSALVPPHRSTAGAFAKSMCRVIIFDYGKLTSHFEDDYRLAYLMTLKAAQTVRERLHCLQVETLNMVPA